MMDGEKKPQSISRTLGKYVFQSLPECGSGPLAKGSTVKFQASLRSAVWKRTQTAPHRAHSRFKAIFETAIK